MLKTTNCWHQSNFIWKIYPCRQRENVYYFISQNSLQSLICCQSFIADCLSDALRKCARVCYAYIHASERAFINCRRVLNNCKHFQNIRNGNHYKIRIILGWFIGKNKCVYGLNAVHVKSIHFYLNQPTARTNATITHKK